MRIITSGTILSTQGQRPTAWITFQEARETMIGWEVGEGANRRPGVPWKRREREKEREREREREREVYKTGINNRQLNQLPHFILFILLLFFHFCKFAI